MNNSFQYLAAGNSGIYEILLIVLVLVLIFNGLIKRKILNNMHENMNADVTKNNKHNNKDKKPVLDGEYVEYEIIEENKEV